MTDVGLFPKPGQEKPWDVPAQANEDGPHDLRNTTPARFLIRAGRTIRGIVRRGARSFGWLVLNFLLVEDDEGEHAAGYDKTYKTGAADAWSRVMELRDFLGRGTLNGAEIDLFSRGREPDGKPRRGLFLVFGKADPTDPDTPFFDLGLHYVPNGFDPSQAFVETLHDSRLLPGLIFAALRPGTWITFDRDKNIGIVFDENTGWILYGMRSKIGSPLDRTKAALAIQVETGQVMSFGRTIVGPV